MPVEQERSHTTKMIEVPAPTSWPFVTAFGLTLLFAGLVTSLAVSGVGLLVVLCGAVGWFRNVFPVSKEQPVHVWSVEAPAPVAARRYRTVDRLQAGAGAHRVYIPVRVHPYSAGLLGGVFGGIGMAITACLYGLIAYGSLWYPVNLLAAAALPSLADAGVTELKAFHVAGLIVALISHGVFSLLVGLLFAALLPMLPSHFTAFWGSFLAPVFWTALIASTLHIINPALNSRIDWRWFIASQIAFGLITGYIVAHSKMVATTQALPLAARAGVEAPGLMAGERE